MLVIFTFDVREYRMFERL